jgi:hypothetical protein
MDKYIIWMCAFTVISLSSCDPTYPISVSNSSNEPVTILAKTNAPFRTEKKKTGTTKDGFDIYQLNPHESIEVGMAIAEIDNDIPFSAIKIVQSGDTVSASTAKEIKQLFDSKRSGKLETPYVISIK